MGKAFQKYRLIINDPNARFCATGRDAFGRTTTLLGTQAPGRHTCTAAPIDTTPTIGPDYDEYGNPNQQRRYGWLGGEQRAGDSLAGLLLMGVRLYNPALGRFLQTDPVLGGSAIDYDYTSADPINATYLDGKRKFRGWKCWSKRLSRWSRVASDLSRRLFCGGRWFAK